MAKLLLADDEEVFRASLAIRLRLRGYEVVEAGNGEEAVSIVRRDDALAVVILDYKMPGMRGEQVVSALRRCRPGVKILILTAYGQEELPGTSCCLRKPCELGELIGAIEAACAGGASNRDTAD